MRSKLEVKGENISWVKVWELNNEYNRWELPQDARWKTVFDSVKCWEDNRHIWED